MTRSRNPGRNVEKNKDHDEILRGLVKAIEGWAGWADIKADHISYSNGVPDQIKDSRPDVTAKNGDGAKFVFEVETADALDTDHTKGQFQDFCSSAASVYLVMQSTYTTGGTTYQTLPLAESVLKKWGMQGKVQVGLQSKSGHTWYMWSNGSLVPRDK